MKCASFFILGFTLFAVFASPAQARRFRIPIPFFFGGETIDLVYDLPNEQPFVRDGKFLDIGYLNSRNGNAYVLYHGDRYTKLSDGDIALFTGILGFDPTAEHRAQHASGTESETVKPQAKPTPPNAETHNDNMIVRQPGETREDFAARTKAFVEAHRSSSGQGTSRNHNGASRSASIWFGFLPVIGYVAILFFLARTFLRRVGGWAGSLNRGASRDNEFSETANAAIDERTANLMNKPSPVISSQSYVADRAERYVSARAVSGGMAARTFGRRNA